MCGSVSGWLWKSKYILLFFTLFTIVLSQRFLNEQQTGLRDSVSSDGLGYYAYLPATVIYHDFTYKFYDNPINKINSFHKPLLNNYKGKILDKYFCGTSLCLLPFFTLGVVISSIVGTDMNGYTDVFLMLVSLAAIFYFVLSVHLLGKIGASFDISEKVCFFTSLILFFGTHLYHYTIHEPSMSHVYSFFAVTLFFYLFNKLIHEVCVQNIIFLCLSMGLISLIRPPNIIVVLFTPFFFKSGRDFLSFLRKIFIDHFFSFMLGILAFCCFVSLQLIFYYLEVGEFFVFSYEEETFNFLKPEILKVLFSYKKGLFLYTPLIFACLIIILISKLNLMKKAVFGFTFFVFLYVTSSWQCWWYGGGYSNRPFIDILPIFLIVLIIVFSVTNLKYKKIIAVFVLPFLFLNQLMAYQYSNHIMDANYMTKEKYWDIFLETNLTYINEKKIRSIDRKCINVKSETNIFPYNPNDVNSSKEGYHNIGSCILNEKNFYSRAFDLQAANLNINGSFYVIATCMVKVDYPGRGLGLVVAVFNENEVAKWEIVTRRQFLDNEPGDWVRMTNISHIDKSEINEKSIIKVFVMSDRGNCLVDNLEYKIMTEQP